MIVPCEKCDCKISQRKYVATNISIIIKQHIQDPFVRNTPTKCTPLQTSQNVSVSYLLLPCIDVLC